MKIDKNKVKEMSIIAHCYQVLANNVNPEEVKLPFEKEIEKLIKKLQNVVFVFRSYHELAENRFKKKKKKKKKMERHR